MQARMFRPPLPLEWMKVMLDKPNYEAHPELDKAEVQDILQAFG